MRALGICVVSIITMVSFTAFARPPLVAMPAVDATPKRSHLQSGTVLWIDRCADGCAVSPGSDNAVAGTSDLITNAATVMGYPFDDTTWAAIITCVQQVYSPYNITVTDQQPGDNSVYDRCVVGGSSALLGLPDSCGYADIPCDPIENGLSFAFTGEGSDDAGCVDFYAESDTNIVDGMCWIIAQETAHTYGLDHEYMFTDGTSACDDPMTYRNDCGGQKFYRNKLANCSDNNGQPKAQCGYCVNAGLQNSYAQLLTALGSGTPTTTPPDVALISPGSGATTITDGAAIAVTASSQRGVATVAFTLNGYTWSTQPGVVFGRDGQPTAQYSYSLPANFPDGVIDIVVSVADDIGATTVTPTVTVTKGQPCADASTCLAGQQCSAGKCFWAAPTGVLGDACTYPQFCMNGECEGESATNMYCSEECAPGFTAACPMGFDCVATNDPSTGYCLPTPSSGGCCSAGGDGAGAIAMHGGLAAAVLAWLARRRRAAS